MILKIENYIQQHPQVSLAELGLVFKTPLEVIEEMLSVLQRKKRLVFQVQESTGSCSNCRDCSGCR